jgi:site-specific DNA-adenine methylase
VLCVPLYILVGYEGLSLSSDDSRMQKFIPKSIKKLIINLYNNVETDVEKYFTDLYLAYSNGYFPNLMEI